MRKPARSIVAALLSGLVATALLAPAVAAKSLPDNIDVYACDTNDGTNPWRLAANTPVVLTSFWGSKSQGQGNQFIQSSEWFVSIDGVPIANPDDYWQAPFLREDGFWVAAWIYPTQIVLTPGQTVSVYFHQELTSPVYDGFGHYPSGVLFDFVCTARAGNP